jgi:hypothetical protein
MIVFTDGFTIQDRRHLDVTAILQQVASLYDVLAKRPHRRARLMLLKPSAATVDTPHCSSAGLSSSRQVPSGSPPRQASGKCRGGVRGWSQWRLLCTKELKPDECGSSYCRPDQKRLFLPVHSKPPDGRSTMEQFEPGRYEQHAPRQNFISVSPMRRPLAPRRAGHKGGARRRAPPDIAGPTHDDGETAGCRRCRRLRRPPAHRARDLAR